MTLKNTQARLFHGSNLRNWPKEIRKDFEENAFIHILKCQHPKCIFIRKNGYGGYDSVVDSFIWAEENNYY